MLANHLSWFKLCSIPDSPAGSAADQNNLPSIVSSGRVSDATVAGGVEIVGGKSDGELGLGVDLDRLAGLELEGEAIGLQAGCFSAERTKMEPSGQ
jgi:hypothetical protein